jgi:hypothetical protein
MQRPDAALELDEELEELLDELELEPLAAKVMLVMV